MLALLFASTFVRAQSDSERILSYDSEITVHDDGSMDVTESIRVHATGDRIRHGIYRDFPTEYKNQLGIVTHVPFEVVSVTRDGQAEPFHTTTRENGVRVYMGPRFSTVAPGDHTYVLTYRTDRQLGFYSDRDELYWNVTGNGWDFPIDHATARVNLPYKIPRRLVETYAFTGPVGYTARDFKAHRKPDDSFFFETTKPFGAHEGLTVVCWWDKGYMQEPTPEQKRSWFIEDNEGLILAIAGLALVLIYQFVTWSKLGKDPHPGTIMPQYMPPQELSPAGIRELVKMRFDNKCFAACVVSMAAKKYLTIEKDALDAYTLVQGKDPKAAAKLTPEERSIANRLFTRGDRLLLKQVNRDVISDAVKALKTLLATNLENVYFVRNSRYVVPSVVLSVVTMIVATWTADAQLKPVAFFMLVWVAFWTFGISGLMLQVVNLWKQALHGGRQGFFKAGGAIFLSLFAVPFLAGEVVGIAMLAHSSSVITVLIFGVLIASNFVFHELLKAPTHLGREMLDKIAGFKMFLEATDGDEIKRSAPVLWNADTFNRFLPYAVALDVEEAWSAKFTQVLATAAAAAATASAAYSGAIASAAIGSGFASSIGDSLAGAISSSTTAPGSSSGSSGGRSSGGGGGGGGGGGW